ncbi:MAG: hypothetical protein ACK2UJ_02025 [Candidatus Promineifilaceae bacterium]|jgi:hypothetical protein
MTTKADFTADEWAQIISAPVYAGMGIIAADPAITSMFKESAALAKAMLQNPVPEGGQELIGSIVAEMQSKADNKDKLEEPQFESKDPQAVMQQIYDYLSATIATLSGKATAAEITAYKEWLLSVAQSVAESGKEGGFLGIGAVRVSDKEETVLANYRKTLGL